MDRDTGPQDRPRLPRADVLKARIAPAEFYVRELPEAPTLRTVRDDWSQNIRCPFHDDPQPSFGVNLRTGAFRCFGCDAQGGSILDFAMLRDGLTFDDARAALVQRYGIQPGAAPEPQRQPGAAPTKLRRQPKPGASPAAPIPPDALKDRPTKHSKHGPPSATWVYRDAAGRPVAFVHRFDPATGRKQFSPQTWTDARGWQWKAPPEPRPLYRLDALAARPDAPVLICEGEKAADAAAELLPDMVATATMNGAQAPAKSDLSPLRGRRVAIWPDADDPGAAYARTVAELAHAAGAASVSVLDLAHLAEVAKDGH
jgi:DNA primase